MNFFDLSPMGMVLASIPLFLTLIAAICWRRALKSTKYGADLSTPGAPKWLRLLTAAIYIVTFQILILVFPRFGWGGVFLIVPFMLAFVLVTVWLLFPTRLAGSAADSRRAKIDDFFWRRTPVKRWFVAGNPMCIIHVVRRVLALAVLILLLAFGAFTDDDTQSTASDKPSGSYSTTDDRSSAPVADKGPAAPKTVGDKPSASPKPTQSANKTEKPQDCGTPTMASDSTNSELTTKYIEVCKGGSWKKWADAYSNVNDLKVKVVFEEWVSKDGWGYGRITFDSDKSALVRFKLSDI